MICNLKWLTCIIFASQVVTSMTRTRSSSTRLMRENPPSGGVWRFYEPGLHRGALPWAPYPPLWRSSAWAVGPVMQLWCGCHPTRRLERYQGWSTNTALVRSILTCLLSDQDFNIYTAFRKQCLYVETLLFRHCKPKKPCSESSAYLSLPYGTFLIQIICKHECKLCLQLQYEVWCAYTPKMFICS